MLAACAQAITRGHEVYAQVSCQPLTMEFTLDNAYPLNNLVAWEPLIDARADDFRRAFADAGFRAAFRDDLATPVKGRLFYGDWTRLDVAECASSANAALEGRSIADIAGERGADPVDVFFDLALEEDLATVFTGRLLNVDEDAIEPMLHHEASLVSLSDAGAHLTFMCDAGYGLRLLGHWVRERRSFTLGEAIHQVSARPASIYRIPRRGRLAPGYWADMMLFDPDRIDLSKPIRRHDLPAGDSRLVREAIGLEGVWVNGIRIFADAALRDLGAPPGKLLREFDGQSAGRCL